MGGSERPKTLGKACTDQRGPGSFQDIEISSLRNGIILRPPGLRVLVKDAQSLTDFSELGRLVGVEGLNATSPHEVLQHTCRLLARLPEDGHKHLDLREKVLYDKSIAISRDSLHSAVFSDEMVSRHNVQPLGGISAFAEAPFEQFDVAHFPQIASIAIFVRWLVGKKMIKRPGFGPKVPDLLLFLGRTARLGNGWRFARVFHTEDVTNSLIQFGHRGTAGRSRWHRFDDVVVIASIAGPALFRIPPNIRDVVDDLKSDDLPSWGDEIGSFPSVPNEGVTLVHRSAPDRYHRRGIFEHIGLDDFF